MDVKVKGFADKKQRKAKKDNKRINSETKQRSF
jgi:hypothetical protein